MGKPCLARMSFGRPVSREDFASSDGLIGYCEKTVKRLSI